MRAKQITALRAKNVDARDKRGHDASLEKDPGYQAAIVFGAVVVAAGALPNSMTPSSTRP